jgi:hypothetical protein
VRRSAIPAACLGDEVPRRRATRTTRTTLHVAAVTIPAPPAVAQVIGCGLLAVALSLVGA